MFLAGDLGGTKTILATFALVENRLVVSREQEFSSQDYDTFDTIVSEYRASRSGEPLLAACFGVAGTVLEGRSHLTNLRWVLEEEKLARLLGVPRVKLLNDLESTAYGMLTLPPEEMALISPGDLASKPCRGNISVIAAGTGLGEAMLWWDGHQHHAMASEGGHADFAPRSEREVELWRFLRETYGGHISYERVLSGPGFLNIYAFLRDHERLEEPKWLANTLAEGDRNAIIAAHGLAGDVPLCVQTVSLFASIYGAEAGNLALRCVASGGVFLGGGIAPKLLPALKSDAFLKSFREKGRFAKFLSGITVSVSLNPRAALLGAAHVAQRQSQATEFSA